MLPALAVRLTVAPYDSNEIAVKLAGLEGFRTNVTRSFLVYLCRISYSYLRATIGSTFIARRAGIDEARNPAPSNVMTAAK